MKSRIANLGVDNGSTLAEAANAVRASAVNIKMPMSCLGFRFVDPLDFETSTTFNISSVVTAHEKERAIAKNVAERI